MRSPASPPTSLATESSALPSLPLPFLPFVRSHIDEATITAVGEVLRSGWITTGPQNQHFEAALSEYCGGRPVCTFNSGTATLEVALRLAGVGPGDEVITTPLSWVATSNTILEVGAKPVFVDIDPRTRNIDLQQVERAITPRTKALMPVDLAGFPVDRDQLYTLAKAHKLRVIEDAAQSFGSHWKGKRIGALGDLVSFSFHANKNLTCIEGGALVLNTEEEAVLARKYRLQGVTRSGFDGMEVDVLGGKFNLSDVAACVGLHQLPTLPAITAQRQALAQHYFVCFERFAQRYNLPAWQAIDLPLADWEHSNWHMFQIVLPLNMLTITRAEYMAQLHAHQIGSGVHYPPIHLFKLYRALGFTTGMYPHAEHFGQATLTLPLFPAMDTSDVERVVEALYEITECYAR
jgi:dTDP-4-amino-4,6-dideoxygalactose transaminase